MNSMSLRREGLTWHAAGDDIVVLDLQQSVYLRLTGSGRFVWELLDQRRSEDELADAVRQRYGIEPSRASDDVAQFIAQLRARDLLVDEQDAAS